MTFAQEFGCWEIRHAKGPKPPLLLDLDLDVAAASGRIKVVDIERPRRDEKFAQDDACLHHPYPGVGERHALHTRRVTVGAVGGHAHVGRHGDAA